MQEIPDFPFRFDPGACQACGGACCRVGGYVWITVEELEVIAEYLEMDPQSFSDGYVRGIYGKLSLNERNDPGDQSCVMFDKENNICTIYPIRPRQCRSYPFWDQYKKWPQQVVDDCPGVRLTEK